MAPRVLPSSRLLLLTEFVIEQRLNLSQGLISIGTGCIDLDRDPQTCSQHHHAHDAFSVDALRTAGNENLAVELAGELREFGCRPGVQAKFIADDNI